MVKASGIRVSRQSGWRLAAKGTFDFTCAAVGLAVLSPVLAVVALAIRISMGRPVLFRQIRPGKHGQPFRMLKFRTMRERQGPALGDAERLTRAGRMIRAASLDELPQLWNVLRGEISLVGPRPLLMQYLDRYSPEQARRHDVMPGITGWAQINGRNTISWDEKFALDVWYVDNWSLTLDLRILFTTVLRVLRREGISQNGHATMPEFMGSKGAQPSIEEDVSRVSHVRIAQ